MEIPYFFYDKKLSDIIRDIIMNSVINIDEAILYMKNSKDYKRDSFIVKKLSNAGMSFKNILPIIKILND